MQNIRLRASSILFLFLVSAASLAAELRFNTQDFPPFNYEIEGVVSGPAADIIRAVCRTADIECTFSLLPWRRAQDEVKNGKANGMFVIGWNAKRAEWVHFSPPLMNTEYGFFVRSDNLLAYNQIRDIENYNVGVYGPSNTATSLQKIGHKMEADGLRSITIDMRPDDEAGFRKLALGRLDAVYSNRDVGFALVAKLGLKEKIRYSGPQRKLKYYVGFSKAHNERKVLESFDAAYRTLHQRGVIKRILDQYDMQPASLEESGR